MATSILKTFQKGVSILASLPLSVTLGGTGFACIPQTLFIMNVTPWVQAGRIPEKKTTIALLLCQAVPTLVLISWAMGFLINRTAHGWFGGTTRGQKSGLQFASVQKSREHDFLYPMVGYSIISLSFISAMFGFTNFWDDGLSIAFAPEAIVLVLGNLLAWVAILYFYASIFLAAPITVLHRRGIITALRASYKLSKDEATRWEVLAIVLILLILGFILNTISEAVILNGIFGSVDNKRFAYCVHFDLLLIILLPLYSSVVTGQFYRTKMKQRAKRKKITDAITDDMALLGFLVE